MAKMTLDELPTQLAAIYGRELVAVVLYGSAARGEHVAKRSDLNVLVVVERITMEHLRKESPLARAWREAGNPPPLTLTRDEWMGSADIFPIEYADILAHHRVLGGVLPTDGLRVEPNDLRLQLEHEAMSKLLRLRHAVMAAGQDRPALKAVLEDSLSTTLVLLRATLRLLGEEPPADSERVCARVKERSNVDTAGVQRVIKHARGEQPLSTNDIERAAQGYLDTAQALVAYLNRYGEQIGS